ncbi:MAG TPA: serine/threonine-protein kinase [Terriglobales bacterium]|nr:serine/threonine-protein kinase [Terriglobales bacterium]
MTLQTIGRYNIAAELGKGAMGVVYKATDPNIGRTVAIKTTRLDTHGLETADLLRRFRNEARSAGTLNHPNIVTIYDAGEQDGVFYIAMEYIEGETLHALLSQHRSLPVEKVIDIVRQVCAGLDYAHAHGVIHRDIKPANIMLAANGVVKVMDFGIAKAGGTMTATGQVLGTPNYMSPEQVKGKSIDGRSDLFSVGVLLYEMLTGEKPFDGQNVTTIIYKIVSENPIPPRELDVTIHPGLSVVVTKALAKAPDERYQTGAALVADLANYKSFGSEAGATQLISPVGDRTLVTPPPAQLKPPVPAPLATAPVAAKAPAPPTPVAAPPRTPVPAKPPAGKAPTKGMNTRVLAGIVVLLLIAGIAAWRVHRRHQQVAQEAAATQAPPAAQEPAAQPPTSPPPETATAPATTQPAETTPAAEPPLPPQPTPRAASKSKAKTAAAQAAPAPPPPTSSPGASATGTVHVTSTPPGATVTIDGGGSFITPFDSPPLQPGAHFFSISKVGYAAAQRKLDVVAGKATNLDVPLAVSGAVLEVQSDPPGAAILVDEKPTNKFTPAKLAIPQGEHKVRLRMEGYKDENTVIQLAEGQTFGLSPKLAPAKASKLKRLFGGGGGSPEDMGTLDVATHPGGAHVTLNNAAAAQTTPTKVSVKPGKYDLAIILPGYKTVHRTVEIEKGKTLGVDEVLEKEKP